jgi:hypothetical protein
VISVLGLRQENHDFKASLGYIVRPCLKKQKTPKTLTEDSVGMWKREIYRSTYYIEGTCRTLNPCVPAILGGAWKHLELREMLQART